MYARLAEAHDDGVEGGGRPNLARIYQSMSAYPEMVGGEGRFCTALMQAYNGRVVGKVGADGCYGIAVRAHDENPAIGMAVKVEDGNIEVLYVAVMEILERLNIGAEKMREQLHSFQHPLIVNTVGVVTGKVTHQFKLRAISSLVERTRTPWERQKAHEIVE